MRAAPLQQPLDRQHRQKSDQRTHAGAGAGLVVQQHLARRAAVDPLQAAVGAQLYRVGRARQAAVELPASCSASDGLSISRPISVFSLAERGSKLNEPTKMRRPSTAKVLACRPAVELLADLRGRASASASAVGLSSNSCTPARSSSLRRLRVAGVHRRLVGRRQRVGQDPHPTPRRARAASAVGAVLARHEVGRDEVERLSPAARTPAAASAAAARRSSRWVQRLRGVVVDHAARPSTRTAAGRRAARAPAASRARPSGRRAVRVGACVARTRASSRGRIGRRRGR